MCIRDSLIGRMTGEFVMTQDSAFASMLYDIHKKCWREELCKIYGINTKHIAKIVKCTDKVGELSKKAADELELEPGTAVFSFPQSWHKTGEKSRCLWKLRQVPLAV